MTQEKETLTKVTVFYPTGTKEEYEYPLKAEPGYDELKAIIGEYISGDFEHVNVWQGGEYTDMFVDEMGKLKGLAHNEAATTVYRENLKTHRPAEYEQWVKDPHASTIVGVAVLFHRKVWF